MLIGLEDISFFIYSQNSVKVLNNSPFLRFLRVFDP